MTRFASSTNQAEAEKSAQSFGFLADFKFDGGDQHYTTRAHPVTWNGNTYLPLGYLVNVSLAREDIERRPNAIRLALSGIPAAFIALAQDSEEYFGKEVWIYAAWFDESDQLVATPEGPLVGTMSHTDIKLGRENAIGMNCENELAKWGDAKELPYTDQTQKRFWPTDDGFDQGPFQRDKIITWGGHRVNTGSSPSQPNPPRNPRYAQP